MSGVDPATGGGLQYHGCNSTITANLDARVFFTTIKPMSAMVYVFGSPERQFRG